MKLSELKHLIDCALETFFDYEDHEVVIAVELPYDTAGENPTVPLRSAFDWMNGKFILAPEENLTPADRGFQETMMMLQDKLHWSDYEKDNLKAEIRRLKKILELNHENICY